MPGKDPNAMHKYVKDKNNVGDASHQGKGVSGKGSHDDLKMPPPKVSTANSQKQRSKGQPVKQSAPVRDEQRSHNRQHSQRESHEQKYFYDTDADSLGQTSTVGSVQGGNNMVPQQHHQQQLAAHHNRNQQHQASSSGSEEDGSSDPEDSDLPEYSATQATGNRLSAEQLAKMKNVEAAVKKLPDGRNLPYITGDSYPTTTSGRPSDIDANDTQSAHFQASQVSSINALPSRELSHRQQLSAASAQQHVQLRQPTETYNNDQQRATTGLLARQDGPNNGSDQIPAGFAFAKPPNQAKGTNSANQKQSARPLPRTRDQSAPDTVVSNAAASTNTTQKASLPRNNEPVTGVKKKLLGQSHLGPQAPAQHPHGQMHIQSGHQITQKQHSGVKTSPEYEQFSDNEADVENDIVPQTQTQGQGEEREEALDYEAPELFDMDYQELKAQSFDLDPNVGEFKLPAQQQDDVLPIKLSTISVLQPQDQYDFFKGLSLDDWEHAGDWFLDRFGEIVGKLKDNRQEKRKAARLFENEVESRHKAVGKKRKQIEDSLGEMKESGGKVLQGTPKKAKSK